MYTGARKLIKPRISMLYIHALYTYSCILIKLTVYNRLIN